MTLNYIIEIDDALKALKFVSHAQSKEETRYYLVGVFFDKKAGERLRLIATDGHRLHSIYIGDADETEFTKLISTADIKAIIASLTHYKKTMSHFILVDNGYRIDNLPIMPIVEIDGTFPPYQRVIPEIENEATAIGHYQARYLLETFKAFADLYKDSYTACTMQSNSAHQPALIIPHANEQSKFNALAVIMPTRV
jgi:DNA polymerase III sliding clamp (beta) subunit (PCNA family)